MYAFWLENEWAKVIKVEIYKNSQEFHQILRAVYRDNRLEKIATFKFLERFSDKYEN